MNFVNFVKEASGVRASSVCTRGGKRAEMITCRACPDS